MLAPIWQHCGCNTGKNSYDGYVGFNKYYVQLQFTGKTLIGVDVRMLANAADDVANALAFALRFSGRKRVHNADELMAQIVAERLVDYLARAGFVIMKKPPVGGSAPMPPHNAD